MDDEIQINEKPRESPVCPHCDKEIRMLNSKKIKSIFGVRWIYFCAHCRKVLGVSQRKGFFMG